MGRKVLILNADYRAISICTVPKAFLLVYLNKAELVAESEKERLRSINNSFASPSIIRLNKYVSVPYRNVVMTRQNIFKRDNNTCVYCGKTTDLTLDHVIPKARGGKTHWENLVTACKRCNSTKGCSTPDEANMNLKYKPVKPSFLMFVRDCSGKLEEKWLPFLSKAR
ncbi:HNH endonuclease [Lacihabitans sp. LS3-19]|uniref:HNH endonuclease n=1 Tax=Lacihabitans sp. LS3-19 TaxID=2487335 RepID=UPI0020CC0DC6|nr:HNH endonuclease [Lacihabitans sp. LS3-19]MCP9768800.1 HNH endonuclease [Lacihabitans sp. LS3-19]